MTFKQIYTRLFFSFPFSFLTYAIFLFSAFLGIDHLIAQIIAWTTITPLIAFLITNL